MNLNKKIPAITFATIIFIVGLFFSFLIIRKYNQISKIEHETKVKYGPMEYVFDIKYKFFNIFNF